MITELDNTAKAVLQDKYLDAVKDKTNVFYLLLKRVFDIFIALIGCIFLFPMAIAIKIAFMCTGDFHTIFYIQDRIGMNGKNFKLYKFRSMVPNADKELKKILKKDKKLALEYKINKKLENDPRITKIGNLIRKCSIDEFPQFINILKGDMAVVGNRPYLPRERKDMGNYFKEIVKTKPGLTGFWQVSLRNRGTFEQRLKMEKYYSSNRGLRFDLSIFLKTFDIVLSRKGAK